MPDFGPLGGLTATNDSSVGTVAWGNPLNVLLEDGSHATAVLLLGEVSQYLRASQFQFGIGNDSTILGITVEIKRVASLLSATQDSAVRLFKAGTPVGTDHASGTSWPTTAAFATYGGSADLWGTTWTPADINASGFGVGLAATALLGVTASLDYIRLTVTYQGSNRMRSGGGCVSGLVSDIH